MPNDVRVLDDCADAFPFIQHLEATEVDTSFYLNLIQLRKDNKWTKLKSIPQLKWNHDYPAYVNCLLELSQTIPHILLADKVTAIGFPQTLNYCTYEFNQLAKGLIFSAI